MSKTIESTVAFQDPQGNALVHGFLTLDLSQPCEITSGGGQVAPTRVVVDLDSSGKVPSGTTILANDELTPSGTTYLARLFNSHHLLVSTPGDWSIAGSSPIDLSLMVPTNNGASYSQAAFVNGNNTFTGTNTFSGATTISDFSKITSGTANPAQTGKINLANTDTIKWRDSTNSNDVILQDAGAAYATYPADMLFWGGSAFACNAFVDTSGGNPSSTGVFRLQSMATISWRNHAGSGDVSLSKDSSDNLSWPNSISIGTKVSSYNGISTVSNGIPSELATIDATGQNAAIATATLYAVPSSGAGQYLLTWNAKVTAAAGVSSTLGALTITYTDPDSVAQTITAAAQISAGTIATTSTGNSTTTVLLGLPMMINAKASTNIQYAMAYASNAANAMQYNLHIKLVAL